MRPFKRHDWVHLSADWRAHLRLPFAQAVDLRVGDWIAAGGPMVVARRLPTDSLDAVRLGFALPGKTRWGCLIDVQGVSEPIAPPPLSEIVPIAPLYWRQALGRMAETNLSVGVFGSFAWQLQAHRLDRKDRYLTEGSDLDLIFGVECWGKLDRVSSLIARHERLYPHLHLDGELELPDGSAVNWREFFSGAPKVLVKGMNHLELLDRDQLNRLVRRVAA